MTTDFVLNRPLLMLRLNCEYLPVESISLTFGLNRVPQAVVGVAVGRSVHTGVSAQLSLLQSDLMKGWVKAELLMKMEGAWDSETGTEWTDANWQRIFRGWAVGISWIRSSTQASAVIHLLHWSADLSAGSTLSEQSHPQNPFDLTFRAVRLQGGAGTNRLPAFLETLASVATEADVQSDIWGRTILRIFEALAEEDHIRLGSSDTCGGLRGSNRLAKRAIENLRRSLSLPQYAPLAMAPGAAASGVAKAILVYLQRKAADSFWHTTYWDLLVGEFCPTLFLQVVPLVEDLLVTGANPTLRTIYKEIQASEIDHLSPVMFQQRALRAVGIWTSTASETNYTLSSPELLNIGGCWMPDPNKVGMVRYLPAPVWLSHVPFLAQDARRTLPTGQSLVSTATLPQKPKGNAPPTMVSVRNSVAGLAQQIAKHYYGLELLQGRSLVCRGKVRFDIAPGSIVRLAGLFTAENSAKQGLVGLVELVTINLSASGSHASTVFNLSHVRTDAENEDDSITLDAHAVYQTAFSGAPLVPELNFSF